MINGKPVIGVTTSYLWTGQKEQVTLTNEYPDAVRHFGGIPLIIPAIAADDELEMLFGQCDGLMLTGGNDVQPSLYGEPVWNDTVDLIPQRDEADWKVCKYAAEHKIPLLGICRGIQVMNVYFGGTLYQDLPSQRPSHVRHGVNEPRFSTCHHCVINEETPLYHVVGQSTIAVNSRHHQAVKDVAPGFAVMAACAEDGVIEAIYQPEEKFMWGIQWHPETIRRVEESSARILEAFINACKD